MRVEQVWRQWPFWRRDEAEDLHHRLRLKVNTSAPPASTVREALLAVVDDHAPVITRSATPAGGYAECGRCNDGYGDPEVYPCHHVRLIADILGVPPHDGVPPAPTP